MSDTIVVALITVSANLVVTLASAAVQTKNFLEKLRAESELSDTKLEAKLTAFQQVTNEKIDELSRRVEKHNKIVERTYALEAEVGKQGEKIKTLFNK